MINARQTFSLSKSALQSWSDDFAPSMGAALAYYTVFSLAPLVLIVIAIAGLVFGHDAARDALFGELHGMMGDQGAAAVQGLVANADKPTEGIVSTIIGIALLLIGASTVFGELQSSLDRIWRAPAAAKPSGLWGMLRTRFLSFGMILGIGFLLMVSLVLSAALAALGKWYGGVFGGWHTLATFVNFALSFVLITAMFGLIYKLMPSVKVQWHDVWIGAGVTALLFTIGKFLIGLYIGKTSAASGFGAAGSLVVLLLWVYYSAQIFLMGAEFTWVYAHDYGSKRNEPRPGAAEVPQQDAQGNLVDGSATATTAPGSTMPPKAPGAAASRKAPAAAARPKAPAAVAAAPAAPSPARPSGPTRPALPPTTPGSLLAEVKAMVRQEPVASFAVGALLGTALQAYLAKPARKGR